MSYLIKVYHLVGSNCVVTDKDLIERATDEDYREISLLVSHDAIDRLIELRKGDKDVE